jgi:hypothetical protein
MRSCKNQVVVFGKNRLTGVSGAMETRLAMDTAWVRLGLNGARGRIFHGDMVARVKSEARSSTLVTTSTCVDLIDAFARYKKQLLESIELPRRQDKPKRRKVDILHRSHLVTVLWVNSTRMPKLGTRGDGQSGERRQLEADTMLEDRMDPI